MLGLSLSAVPAVAAIGGASSIQSLQEQASAIATRVDTLNVRLDILSQQYDAAQAKANSLKKQVSLDDASIEHAEAAVTKDSANLRREAVDAYVNAGAASGISAVLSSNENKLPLQQTYMQAAAGSLDTAISSYKDAEHRLNVRRAVLDADEQAATQNEASISSERSNAQNLEDQLESTLSNVKGELAAKVEQQEAAQRAAAARLAASQASAAAAQQSAPSPASSVQGPPPPAAGGGSAGAAAVRAAESQIGVPYVWGGATPGVGFDCSGLVMWAWAQAGVSLPHNAQAQYDSITHIPFSELEPGDLIFYADGGYIYHVIMYIGGGRAVQAEQTGTLIQITPVWPGAYAAGRP